MKLKSHRTSFVVQGPIREDSPKQGLPGITARCLASIRQWFPGAEIVLSTWRGSNVQGLQFDVLVESDDPGHLNYAAIARVNPNINRMLVSSQNGIAAATRNHVVKTRTDILFINDGLTKWSERFTCRSERTHLFDDRVIVPTVFSVQPRRGIENRLYHLSDWLHAGTRRDIELLWSCPLAIELAPSKSTDGFPAPEGRISLASFSNEQYLWLHVAKKAHPDLTLDGAWDHKETKRRAFEQFLADEVVLLSPEQIGIRHMNYHLPFMATLALFTHGEWLQLYRTYCDSGERMTCDLHGWLRQATANCNAASGGRLISTILAATRIAKSVSRRFR